MANTTVYPYGTGGSLPSSIGLVNDLKTGGVDKALTAEMGKTISGMIDNSNLGTEWVTKDISATWTDGALVALATESSYNTVITASDWKVTDYISIESSYSHLLYRVPQTASNTSTASKCGIIFYDTNKDAIMGFPGGYSDATRTPIYAVPIPEDAAYVKISSWNSSIWDGTLPNQFAKKSGYENNKEAINNMSSLGTVGAAFPLSITAGDDSTVVRNIIGDFVTEYRIGTVTFANRMAIDISGRDMSKYYIFKFKYSCSRDIPNSVYVTMKNSDNSLIQMFPHPNNVSGTSYSQLNRNGIRNGEFINIIPPFMNAYTIISIDTHNETAKTRMVFSDISINEIEMAYDFKKGTIPLLRTAVEYSGEKICVKNRMAMDEYMTATNAAQAMCCFGDYGFIHKDKGGSISVVNLRTQQILQTVTITGASANARNHGNTACFSNQYYQQGDEFPIMYVSSGYTIDGSPRAFGLRIVKTVENNTETFAITLVHTITLNNDSWTEFVFAGDILYIRTILDGVDSWGRMMAPLASDGDVTIETTDILYPVPYDDYLHYSLDISTQGYFYHNNRIFTVWGQQSNFHFGAVNPETGKITTVIPLADLGISTEPESVFLWDGSLFINFYNGKIYRLYFD